MPTGNKLTNLYAKKLLGVEALKDQFTDYLLAWLRELAKRTWGLSGYFSAVVFQFAIPDKFSLSVPVMGADNAGRFLLPADATVQNVQFQNANGIPYHVGLTYGEAPSGAERNPRTGAAKYVSTEEVVGYVGTPDLVADNGNGTITLRVDSVTEAAVSNAGRQIKVWMYPDPKTSVEATAFETLPVVWDGVNNKVTSTGKFGQTGNPSVVAADYRVGLLGPRVARNVNLANDATVAYVGTVTGAGAGVVPAVSSTVNQRVFDSGGIASFSQFVEQGTNQKHLVVKAHGADVGTEPSVAIRLSNGTLVMYLGALGDVFLDSAGGATSKKVRFLTSHVDRNAGDVYASGADVKVDVLQSGGVLRVTGVEANADLVIDKTLYAVVGRLALRDFSTAAIDFSDLNNTAINAALPQTILGALNYSVTQDTLLDNLALSRLLAGATPTNGGGLTVNIAASTYFMRGKLVARNPESVVVPDVSTRYVYASSPSAVLALANNIQLASVEDVLLAKVVTAGGAIASLVDLRLPTSDGDNPLVVTVGPSGSGAFFTKLSDALRVVGEYSVPAFGTTPRALKIQVIGDAVVAEADAPLLIPADGITIEGVRGMSSIAWSGTLKALFNLNGKNDLVFRDLTLIYTDANEVTPAQNRFAFTNTVAGLSARVLFEDIELKKTDKRVHGFFYTSQATCREYDFVRCTATDLADTGVTVLKPGSIERSSIRDCRFQQIGTDSGTPNGRAGIRIENAENVLIDGCWLFGFAEYGIRVGDSTPIDSKRIRIIGCTIETCDHFGIHMQASHCAIIGCHIDDVAKTSANDAFGIFLNNGSVRCQITACSIKTNSGVGAINVDAVHVPAGSTLHVVTTCQFNGQGFIDTPASSTFASNRDDA